MTAGARRPPRPAQRAVRWWLLPRQLPQVRSALCSMAALCCPLQIALDPDGLQGGGHQSASTVRALGWSFLADLHPALGAGLVLTTYEGLRRHRDLLLPIAWGAVILDEGHKIRNPDADITLVAKQVPSVVCVHTYCAHVCVHWWWWWCVCVWGGGGSKSMGFMIERLAAI